jgi:hypothetical protein
MGILREKYKQCVQDETSFTRGEQYTPILSKYPEIEEEIISTLKKQRAVGQPLYGTTIQPLIKAIIKKRAPHLFDSTSKTSFNVSIDWTRCFIKRTLNWSYRASTTAAGKLPKDWEEQGKKMAQRVAYLSKLHDIPPSLVVNTDQTGMHLVPTGGSRTWEKKGSKHICVHGKEDKRQVTVVVSSTAEGILLPFQVVFTGTTFKSLPKMNDGRQTCEALGWDLTTSHNHWSTLQTCKDFVEKILQVYRVAQAKTLDLPHDQPLIWLIDCWSVHKSEEFLTWVKTKHPQILILFIPANCTAVLQPADIIIQRPLKHAFMLQFNSWTMDNINKQLEKGDEVFLDFKMSAIKPLLCSWLHKAWLHVFEKQDMIVKGWRQAGLLRSFEKTFQIEAMKDNIRSPLFPTMQDPSTTSIIEQEFTGEDGASDPNDSMEASMEQSLNRVSKLCAGPTKTASSMANLRAQARRAIQPPPASKRRPG